MIETLAWILPRPRRGHSYYRGGFPLHFERKLLELYGYNTRLLGQMEFFDTSKQYRILHPFGGHAEYGIRVDLRSDVKPHIIADAHALPFRDDTFEFVIVDPPYSDKLARDVYGTPRLKYYTYVGEAVRVCRPGGYVVLYHVLMLPRPKGTAFDKRILLAIKTWHRLRYVGIFRKKTAAEIAERGS